MWKRRKSSRRVISDRTFSLLGPRFQLPLAESFGAGEAAANPQPCRQLGEGSRVAPINKLSVVLAVVMAFVFLVEKPSSSNVLGAVPIPAGVLVAALVRQLRR